MVNIDDFIKDKDEDEIKKHLLNETYYRTSRVRMYYSTTYTKKSTPTPFCEIRVWKVTEKPTGNQEEMIRTLDNIEDYYLTSITEWAKKFGIVNFTDLDAEDELDASFYLSKKAGGLYTRAKVEATSINPQLNLQDTSRMTIKGQENNTKIDGLDTLVSLIRTGLPKRRWKLNKTYRYVCFFDDDGYPKYEYVEDLDNLKPPRIPTTISEAPKRQRFPALRQVFQRYIHQLKRNKGEQKKLAYLKMEDKKGVSYRDDYSVSVFKDRWGNWTMGVWSDEGMKARWQLDMWKKYKDILNDRNRERKQAKDTKLKKFVNDLDLDDLNGK